MKSLALLLAALSISSIGYAQQPDIPVADFEGSDYGAWTVEGSAFGSGPAQGAVDGQRPVSGFTGKGLVNSFHGGDNSTGTLTSPPFKIERKYLSFLIGGGNRSAELNLALLIDGKMVRRATGVDDERLQWKCWDVSDLAGKTAQIQITDKATGGWGHILVDQIMQTDTEKGNKVTMEDTGVPGQREIKITKRYLYLPVKESSNVRKMQCLVDGKPVHFSEIRLSDDGQTDFQAFIDVGEFIGKTLTVKVDRLPSESLALSNITQGDKIRDADGLYHEIYRPQFHFTPARGWHNDPNGLVFYKGEYHLFYQYNPTGLTGAGFNMHWGHAVSPDLVHWKELPIAIYPTETERGIWSGSAVVDRDNTSGLMSGTEPPLVAFYTSVGKGVSQFMVFSNDHGRTWTRYEKNPVLPNIIGGNRDPKVNWHEGTKHWVMALFLDKNDYGLFTSPDLKQWTQLQRLTMPECAECPDFFPMPTAGDANRWVFVAGNGRYLIGDFDGTKFILQGEAQRVEFGNSCYAVQTYSGIPASDGRRIQIGWMNGEHYPNMPYSQQMSFPCVLTLHDTAEGPRLFKYPVAEIAKLHRNSKTWKDVSLAPGENLLKGISGDLFDIAAEFEIGEATDFGFKVRGTEVHYDVKGSRLIGLGATAMPPNNRRIKMRILVDRTSLEVYGNDGQVAMTSRWLPKDDNRSLEIFAKGGPVKIISLEVHELESAWR